MRLTRMSVMVNTTSKVEDYPMNLMAVYTLRLIIHKNGGDDYDR